MSAGPIRFIDIEDDGSCRLNPEAVDMLAAIKEDVCVVSVAGLYRTGKSFLLNRLIGLQEGFEIGPTVNPCTKGLWIWGEPITLPHNRKLVLIDTEGLGSFDRDSTVDMQIITLSVLLSSTFVYNSMGAIDEQAIESLSLVCKLTERIHVKSQADANPEMYASYFPSFIWVLRDFALQIQDEDRNPAAARDYLENCLQPVEGTTEDIKQKNIIRRTILEFFKDRDCFTLIRPLNNEKQLREINAIPYDSLRPKFREQIEKFVNKTIRTIKPKTIDGTPLNGLMLAQLAESYVIAINNHAVPTISTAWERVLSSQLDQVSEQAIDTYKNALQIHISMNYPVDEDTVRQVDKDSRQEVQRLIDRVPVTSVNKSSVEAMKEEVHERLDEIFAQVSYENLTSSRKLCTKLMGELLKTFDNKLDKKDSFHWFVNEWSRLSSV
mmetsp:Transcript_4879/g.9126  ORF Transcript_4879/g.9126 Transcript_4879/m.9126 type:complete len:437 (+) Transcript_4879:1130-2440(+)